MRAFCFCYLQDGLPAADDALSWQQLKLAAEAGFEELLRMQEAAAAAGGAGQQVSSPAWRRPGMTRVTGGGGSTAEAWPGPVNRDWAAPGKARGAACIRGHGVPHASEHIADRDGQIGLVADNMLATCLGRLD